MDADTENERTEIWRCFKDAVRPLEDPQMRIALALAVLSTLLDSPRPRSLQQTKGRLRRRSRRGGAG